MDRYVIGVVTPTFVLGSSRLSKRVNAGRDKKTLLRLTYLSKVSEGRWRYANDLNYLSNAKRANLLSLISSIGGSSTIKSSSNPESTAAGLAVPAELVALECSI